MNRDDAHQARRKDAERAFHNRRFGGTPDPRAALEKWYVAVESGARQQAELIRRIGRGARVLEFGCADGRLSLGAERLAHETGSFHGIDLADWAIVRARRYAASQNLEHCRFSVMDAERLQFPDGAFDVVFGRGILHHLDLDRSLAEIARVLRPGGTAIFYEPMRGNPLLNSYRRLTPHLRTVDEHPLLMRDISRARDHFRNVDAQFFGLLTLAAVPFHRTRMGPRLMSLCERSDHLLLRLPVVRRGAWHLLLTLTR